MWFGEKPISNVIVLGGYKGALHDAAVGRETLHASNS